MILTCPDCESRYLLPAYVLAPNGRTVKCTNCGAEWHEDPDPEELAEGEDASEENDFEEVAESFQELDAEPDPDDIPDAVKPEEEGDGELPASENVKTNAALKELIIGSAGVFAAASLVLLLFSFLLKGPIVSVFPATSGFYTMFGAKQGPLGKGLIFDQVNVKKDGNHIVTAGTLINLTSKNQYLPYLRADFRAEDGYVYESKLFKFEHKQVKAEAIVPFEFSYHAENEKIYDIGLSLVLTDHGLSKTSLADGGNNHAQATGAHDPSGVHAAASESHAADAHHAPQESAPGSHDQGHAPDPSHHHNKDDQRGHNASVLHHHE